MAWAELSFKSLHAYWVVLSCIKPLFQVRVLLITITLLVFRGNRMEILFICTQALD